MLIGGLGSALVKSGLMAPGKFKLSELTLEERAERLFFGAGIPSVRSINGSTKPEDRIDRGGTTAPLARQMDQLSTSNAARLSELTGRPLRPAASTPRPSKRDALSKLRPDLAGARQLMHSGHESQLSFPKKPADADKENW